MVSGGPMVVTTDRADRSTDSPSFETGSDGTFAALDERSVRSASAVPFSTAVPMLDDSVAPVTSGVPALSLCMSAVFEDSGAAERSAGAALSWCAPPAFDGWATSERSTGAALSSCLPAGESSVVVQAAWGSSSGRNPLLPQTFIPLSLSIRQVWGTVPPAWVMVPPAWAMARRADTSRRTRSVPRPVHPAHQAFVLGAPGAKSARDSKAPQWHRQGNRHRWPMCRSRMDWRRREPPQHSIGPADPR